MAVKKATSAAKKAVQPTEAAPTRTGSKAAAKGTAKRAAKVAKSTKPKKAAKAPARPPKKAAAPTVTKGRAASKTAAETTARAPAKAAAKASAKTAAKAPVKRAVKAPLKSAVRTPAKTTAKASAKPKTTAKPKIPAHTGAKATAQPQRMRVTQDEKPWTAREFAGVRTELEADTARLQEEISIAEVDLAGLMRDVGDGAGDDPADAGTATFEREQEMSLANNAREVFRQSTRALARLAQGTYGICESCGNPIGKNRLLAFPRATLCMTCKSKQERR